MNHWKCSHQDVLMNEDFDHLDDGFRRYEQIFIFSHTPQTPLSADSNSQPTTTNTMATGPDTETPPRTPQGARSTLVRWDDLGDNERRDVARMRALFGFAPEQLEKQRAKCEQWAQRALATTPMAQFLLDHLRRRGCSLAPRHVRCEPCSQPREGAFAPKLGVVLCSNYVQSQRHVATVLAHELVMAYDHCTAVVDWNNPEHLACAAIRAANLSTECSFLKEAARLNIGFGKHHQECVKRRAILQVRASPAGSAGTVAEDAVNAVWYECIADTSPFNEVP